MKRYLPRPAIILVGVAWFAFMLFAAGAAGVKPAVAIIIFLPMMMLLLWVRRYSNWIAMIIGTSFMVLGLSDDLNHLTTTLTWACGVGILWFGFGRNEVNPWLLAIAGFLLTFALSNVFSPVFAGLVISIIALFVGSTWLMLLDPPQQTNVWWLPQWLRDSITRRQQHNQTIADLAQRHGQQQEEILEQIREAAAQEERQRLARDLHDSIKQQMWGIHASVAAAQARWDHDPAGAKVALDDVRQTVQAAQAEMRAMLQHMRPTPLASIGLIQAIRDQAEALQHRSAVLAQLELQTLPEHELVPNTNNTLLRIVQEAFANIARHARAQHVIVKLTHDSNNVQLIIQDDGQGFEQVSTDGMGLMNMRERVNHLGGNVEIVSSHGAGTSVSIRIPKQLPSAKPHYKVRASAHKLITMHWTSVVFGTIGTWLLPQIVDMIRMSNFEFRSSFATLGIMILWLVAWLSAGYRQWRNARRLSAVIDLDGVDRIRYTIHRSLSRIFVLTWLGFGFTTIYAQSRWSPARGIGAKFALDTFISTFMPWIAFGFCVAASVMIVRLLLTVYDEQESGITMPRLLTIQAVVCLFILLSMFVGLYLSGSGLVASFEQLGRNFMTFNGINACVLLGGVWLITERRKVQKGLEIRD